MKIRNRPSHINTLPEGSPTTSNTARLTKLFYFVGLILVTGYILYTLLSHLLYYKVPGFVEVEKTVISSSHGGRVLQLPINSEQAIKKNQLLAVIAAAKKCGEIDDDRVIRLKYDIDFNNSKLRAVQQEIKHIHAALSASSLQRALETGGHTESTRQKLELDLGRKKNDAELLKQQIVLQQRQLEELKTLNTRSVHSAECFNEHILAPFDGRIHAINHKIDEYAARGAPLVILTADNASVRIEAYLKSNFYSHLKKGDTLEVTFSDQVKSKGKIEEIHAADFNVSEQEWRRPAEGRIRVHLKPITAADAQLWKRYDRMEVTIRGTK